MGDEVPGRRLWPLLLAALALLAAFDLPRKPLNHDVAWYLFAGSRWLDGARLYVDIIDPNPPLILYLGALATWAGPVLGVSPHAAFFGGVFALALTSAALIGRLLQRDGRLPEAARWAVILALLFSALLHERLHFAQREGIALMLFAPYVLAAWSRAGGAGGAGQAAWGMLAAGLGLAAAVALKPHFALPWLLVELWLVFTTRRVASVVRLESAAAALGLLLFGVHLWVSVPAYLASAVPLAMATYGAYDSPLREVLGRWELLVVTGGSLLLVAFARAWLGRSDGARLVTLLALVSLGFAGAFVVQQKGWRYQLVPAVGFALAAASGALALWSRRIARESLRPAAVAFALLLGVGVVALAGPGVRRWRAEPPREGGLAQLVETVRHHAAGEPIFLLSSSVWPAFPTVNLSGARWPYRYGCLWPLPGLVRGRDGEPSGAEREFVASVVDELIAEPPRLLGVDARRQKQAFADNSFEFVPYFSSLDPRFAELLGGYQRLPDVGPVQLYLRASTAGR